MKTLDFNIGSKIKVIDKNAMTYRFRGTVVKMPDRDQETGEYADDKVLCKLSDPTGKIPTQHYWLTFEQISNVQKKFIDIEHIRESDLDIGNGIVRKGNASAFELGDMIQVTEKIDGANASICFNSDEGKLEVFSHTNLLEKPEDLRGFKAYIETKFDPKEFEMFSKYVIFGEWLVPHTIRDYDKKYFGRWIVYDIWNKEVKNYCPQYFVKQFCQTHHIDYIHVLYEGKFKGWDHVKSFLHSNTYGPRQEGIVVKNQTKLEDINCKASKYLKIVNSEFKETIVKTKKEKSPAELEKIKEYNGNLELMKTIVTEARVKKMIMKLIDENALDRDLKPTDMGKVCKLLPKRMYEDILKEEREIVSKVGADSGKMCSSISIELARKIIVG